MGFLLRFLSPLLRAVATRWLYKRFSGARPSFTKGGQLRGTDYLLAALRSGTPGPHLAKLRDRLIAREQQVFESAPPALSDMERELLAASGLAAASAASRGDSEGAKEAAMEGVLLALTLRGETEEQG